MYASSSTAYLLVTHGSRDPRSGVGASALVDSLQAQHSQQQPSHREAPSEPEDKGTLAVLTPPANASALSIATAVLELGPAPLHQQILDFVQRSQLPAGSRLKILPLFLLPGVHVMDDIPAEVMAARRALDKGSCDITIEVLPYLGSQRHTLAKLLNSASLVSEPAVGSCSEASHQEAEPVREYRILMAHGSRRTGASQHVQALADRLGLPVAYWVQPDSLGQQVQAILSRMDKNGIDKNDTVAQPTKTTAVETESGAHDGATASSESVSVTAVSIHATPIHIEVLPYFLFEGGLTDAIAQRLQEMEEQLRPQFPQLKISLGKTLGDRPGFPALVYGQLLQDNEQN